MDPSLSKMSEAKRGSLRCWWVFTAWCDEEPSFDNEIDQYGVYQREKAPSTGRLHWQGTLQLKKKMRMAQLKAIGGWRGGSTHWEPMISTPEKCKVYCMKDASRVSGPVEWGVMREVGRKRTSEEFVEALTKGDKTYEEIREQFPKDTLIRDKTARLWIAERDAKRPKVRTDVVELRPWQAELEEMLGGEPDKRCIVWVSDPNGNSGKTEFIRYTMTRRPGEVQVFKTMETAHVAYALRTQGRYVFFDLPRDLQAKDERYEILEWIKDGIVTSTKYESCTKYPCPMHVVVFSNHIPDTSRLSADRWHILQIDDSYRFTNYHE